MTEALELFEEIVDTEVADPEPSGPIATPMAVIHKRPAGVGSWPKVVIFHDGPGVRTATHEFARKLAGEGFDVAVPDLYHRHGRMIGFDPPADDLDPAVRQENQERVWAMLRSLTTGGIQRDLDATLAALEIGPDERMGCIGFCLGAAAVFHTMMRLPDQFVAGAMWHPSFLADDKPDAPHRTAAGLPGSLYVGIGDADQMQSIEMHQPFFDAVAALDRVTVEVFAGADHGFTWPGHPNHHEHAATTCFAATTELFRSTL